MNIESALERKLIDSSKDKTVSFLNSHPEYFTEAIELAVSDKQPFSWRAASLVWSCMDENDRRVRPYIKSIVKCIKDKKDGHQRELLKILYKMDIDDKYEGRIFDICMNLWEQTGKDPSVRMTAFKYIIKISRKYPELMEEVAILTQDHYLESLSPGIHRSIERMLGGRGI
jgi:hypothetical protein